MLPKLSERKRFPHVAPPGLQGRLRETILEQANARRDEEATPQRRRRHRNPMDPKNTEVLELSDGNLDRNDVDGVDD